MSKKLTALFSAAGALLVLYIGILLCSALPPKQDSLAKAWGVTAEKLQEIVIEYPGPNADRLVLEKGGDGWRLTEPVRLPYDHALADGLPLNLSYVSAEKTITDSPKTLADYGLDRPVRITVTLSDRTKKVLLLGAATPTGESRYFMVDGGDTVYTMRADRAQSLLLNKDRIRDRNILGFNSSLRPADIAADIQHITYVRNGATVLNAARDANGSWSAQSALASRVADALSRLRAVDFVEEKQVSREAAGVEPAERVIRFTDSNGEKTIVIGAQTKDGSHLYASLAGADEIVTVPLRGFDFL